MGDMAQQIIEKYPKLMKSAQYCDCPPGWARLLDALAAELTENYPAARCNQFKEKFGALRFYTEGVSSEALRVIDRYEQQSTETCQDCGAPGTLVRNRRGWFRTACPDHAKPA